MKQLWIGLVALSLGACASTKAPTQQQVRDMYHYKSTYYYYPENYSARCKNGRITVQTPSGPVMGDAGVEVLRSVNSDITGVDGGDLRGQDVLVISGKRCHRARAYYRGPRQIKVRANARIKTPSIGANTGLQSNTKVRVTLPSRLP